TCGYQVGRFWFDGNRSRSRRAHDRTEVSPAISGCRSDRFIGILGGFRRFIFRVGTATPKKRPAGHQRWPGWGAIVSRESYRGANSYGARLTVTPFAREVST